MALAAFFAIETAGAAPSAQGEERSLSMHNIHTKEDINIVFKRNGQFIPEALAKLDHFMRDWRRNVTIKIDPDLYDVIWETRRDLGSKAPINLICGHRSAATNEGLRRTRGGQARGSLHITGKAADIQFTDVPIKQLRNSALILERGGVGYYPSSSIPFVHVDTGRVRHWPRMARQELAILFPAGHSKHVPSDGRPLTQGDYRVALASLQEKGGELPLALQRRMRPGGAPSTVLASLTPDTNTARPQPAIAEAKPKQAAPVFASLTPSFGGSRLTPPEAPAAKPAVAKEVGEPKPIIQARTEPTSVRPDAAVFNRDVIGNQPATPEDDDVADEVEYDEDEMSDELAYQPYPAMQYMGDTPVSQMDMTGPDELTPAKILTLIGETRDMLHYQFQPGIQTAELYWSQRFRGSAVNTALRRVERDSHQAPVKTAQTTK